MSKKDETLFDEAEMTEEMPTEEYEQDEEMDESMEVYSISVPTESPKDKLERKGIKAEMDGKILTITEVKHTNIRTKDQQGNKIEPKPTLDGTKFFYPGKLAIRFEEEHVVEYYPSFRYFVSDDGKINTIAKINRRENGDKTNAVYKLFKLAVPLIGKPEDEISDQEFYDFLIGKKVKIKTEKGIYNKKPWFRNDIVSFVED